ncbi:hypothetical protein BT63DRAFT_450181 [Microthyrium microscopicum]|uniref:3-keto-steroid reductase n=1 Tax=Microthyrium microscopicum TaxID=703497 RepID=A0A6A6UUS2_9PEZI|nr:hypothetical protein BT63DRAFT_450181 [Microthyrium microscopicum]
MSSPTKDSGDRDTLYVLVTGANSGVGYAICTRIITNFLLTRPANQHLHLIPTTRSQSKAIETVESLQQHIEALAAGNIKEQLFFYTPPSTPPASPTADARALFSQRVTIDPILLDLCSIPTVFSAARALAASVPRLDVLICNAGIGGWSGLDWWGAWRQFYTEGVVALVGKPAYKKSTMGLATKQQLLGGQKGDEPPLGEVFCANLFGHYIFVHEVASLLNRGPLAGVQRSRVVWCSTNQVEARFLESDDFQGLKTLDAYESSKVVTDLVAIGSQKEELKSRVQDFFTPTSTNDSQDDIEKSMVFVSSKDATSSPSSAHSGRNEETIPPVMYLSHPGICLTSILPLPIIVTYLQLIAFYLARFFGSKWHVNTAHKGATAPVWLAMESDELLEKVNAKKIKWGSGCNRWGKERVIPTHMDYWGLEGEEDKETGEFTELAKTIWDKVEHLRVDWTDRVGAWERKR